MWIRTSVVGVGVVVLLAGCTTGDGMDLQTPTTTGSGSAVTSSPSATTPTVSADEQAVLDAYAAFYAAAVKAQADPKHSQDYLEPVATGAQFEATNGGLKAGLLNGEEAFGEPVLRPVVASIDGDTAEVHDCQDNSKTGRRKIDTGEVIVVGRGPESSATTTLQRIDGAWKVAATEYPTSPGVYC